MCFDTFLSFNLINLKPKRSKQQKNNNYLSNLEKKREKKIKENKAKNGFRELIRPHISHRSSIAGLNKTGEYIKCT